MSIIFLLPMDYISHNTTEQLILFNLPDKAILYIWKINYWTTFILTWLILPMLQEFYKSGHQKALAKLKDSIKQNIKFQLIMLGVSLLGMFYLILEVGITTSHLKMMIIALSHIYSLIIATWLMGHGLISIPRNKWISGSVIKELNYNYLKLPKLVDELEDIKITFREQVLVVVALKRNFTSDSAEDFMYRDWILKLYASIPAEIKENVERQYLHENTQVDRHQLNDSFMTKLDANFNSNLHRFIGYQSEYNNLLSAIIKLEDILNSTSTKTLSFRIDNHKTLLSPRLNFIYHYHIRPIFNRITSILLALISFIILQSEFFHSTNLSLLNTLIYSKYPNIIRFLLSSLIFSYMLFCALNSLTHLKIFNVYNLVRRDSDPVSTSWYTTYIARLTIPLSYNFITMFVSRESIFEDWFGKSIHLTGLFNLLNNWLPRLILIPVLLAMFHVYEKLKKRLGLTGYDSSWAGFDDETEGEEGSGDGGVKRNDLIIVEAKRIVNRELARREMQLLRPFQLGGTNESNPDLNYENNRRREFHDLVSNNSNRIDYDEEENIEPSSINYFNGTIITDPSAQRNNGGIWGRIGNTFSGIRNSVNKTFGRQSSVSPSVNSSTTGGYRDNSLDDFNYDDDANENLIV
ncbi:uncharacterized protein J8A68_002173 [[Candida] subhashii]|uniref:LMBR1 domain-containing protein 2 n=1 Tax=[Candida] subhashii TaxID=561895 RepID=A0A8J5QYE9_9ASCO|nr:uncharacterized protein J8A68_002173 [[Candida] subhashii]KAG7664315.1 hypothetical protein J8A68_002173 [[Candida] subhashii]